MKFGQLILRRIVKIFATKCQILRLKCTKIDFDFEIDFPRPRWGSLQRSPRPASWISEALLLREGDIGREGKGRRRQGEGKKG